MNRATDKNDTDGDEKDDVMTTKRAKHAGCDALSATDRAERVRAVTKVISTWKTMAALNAYHLSSASVGKGSYGSVIGRWVAGTEPVAVKTTQLRWNDQFITFKDDPMEQMLCKLEPTFATFLTKHMLRHCPHFCDSYAYSIEPLLFSDQDGSTLLESFYGSTILLMHQADGSLCDRLEMLFRERDVGAMMSLIVQVIVTIGVMGRIGMSHNDMRLENILIDKCDRSAAIRYAEADGSDEITVRTHGSLALLCDFGIASQIDFWNSGRDPRTTECVSVGDFYVDANKVQVGKPRHYRMYRKTATAAPHPLYWVEFRDHERDLVAFCNLFIFEMNVYCLKSRNAGKPFVPPITVYLNNVLDELAANDGVDAFSVSDFAKKVTRPSYVGRFCEPSLVFVSAKSVPPSQIEHYTYPTKAEADALRKELVVELTKEPQLEKIHT